MAYNDDENPYGDEYEYGDEGRDYKNLGHLEDAIEREDQTYEDLEALDKKVKEWEDKQRKNEKKAEEVSSKAKKVVSNSKKNKAKINEIKKELGSDVEFGDNGNVVGHTPTYNESFVEFNVDNSPFAFLDDISGTVRRYNKFKNQMEFREYLSKQLKAMGAGRGIDTINMISEGNDDWLTRNDGSGLFIVLEKLKENFGKIGGVFDNDINPLKEWDASKDISTTSKNVDILYKLFEEGGIDTLITGVYKKLPRMKDNPERVDWDAYNELKENGDPLHDVYTNLHYILGISNSLKNMKGGMHEKSFQYIADDYFSKYGNRLPLDSEQFKRAYNRAPKPETDTFRLDEVLSEIAKSGNVHVSDIQKGLQAFGFPYEELSKDPDFISRLKQGQLFGEPTLGDSSNSKYSSKNDAELLLEILNKLEGGNSIYDRLLEVINGEVGELMGAKKPDEKVPEEVFEKGDLIKALALEYGERDEKGARFDLGNDLIKWEQYMPQLIKIYEDITGEKFDKSILPQEPKKPSNESLNDVSSETVVKLSDIKGISSLIPDINKNLELLRNAILDAVGYMKNAFGYAPGKASKRYDEEVSSVSPHKYLKTVKESKDTTQTIEQVIANSDLETARERFREVQKEIGMLRGEGMSSEEIKTHPLMQESHELQNTIKELMLESTGSYDVGEEIKELKSYIASTRRSAKNTTLPSLLKEYEKRIKDAEEMIKILEMGDVESFQNDYYASFQGIPKPNPFVNNLTNIMNEVYGGTNTSISSNPKNKYRPHPRIKGEPDGENVLALFGQRFRYLRGEYDDLKNKILPLQNVVISPNVSDETKEEYNALVKDIKRVHDALMSLRTNKSFNVEWEDELNEIVKGYEGVALSVDEVIKREEVLDALYGEEFKKLDARNRQGINELFGFDRDYGVDPKYAGKELKDNTKAIESPLNRAQSSLSKFAWQFDRATYSATQLNGVVTKLFAIVGSGSAVNDMITASSLRQTNQIMLASRRGMEEAQKLYDRIQMLVVKLPGNDTFLTNILTMLGTMDESLTAEDLEYMGGIIADYYMGAQAKGQFNNETERELRNYLMTGQTRNLTNSIIASEVESLKNLNSVKERTMALEKALQTTGMDSIAHYKSYHNTLEEFKGRFQKSFADLGDLYLGFLQGLMEVYNFLDSISGSFLSQLTISLGVFALGALGLTVVLAQVTQTMAGTVDAIKHLKDAVETGKGLEGEYGEAIRKALAWLLFKVGLINEETASKVINTDATLRNTISEKLNSLSIRENINSKVASTIAWFGNTKQKVVARLETYKNILATKLETLNMWIENREVRKNTMEWARNTKEKAKNRLAGYGDRIKGFLGGKLGVESTWGSIFGDVFGRGVNMLFRVGRAIVRFLDSPLGKVVGRVGAIIALVVLAVRYVGQLFGWWSSFGEMFQAFGDGIRRTWEAFVNSEPVQYMITTFQNFAYTLEGVFNLIRDIGGSIWEMIFGVDKGGNKVFDIVGLFLEVIGAIGNIAFMFSPIRVILDIINAIGSAIAWVLDTWNEFIDSAEFQGLLKDFQEIREIIGEAWSTLTEAFNEVRDAFMSVFEDDDEMKEMVENTNILLDVLRAVAIFLRVTVVPVIRLIAYIIKGIADVIKFVVDVGIGVVDFFTGGALTNEASSLPTQKQLAQSYSNRVNNTQTIINNNFASGSVLTDARNMTAKEVMKLFTSAFGFNKSRGVNGVLS